MKDRPETLSSVTVCTKTGYGNLYVTVCELDGKPFEVFATIGKSGKSIMAKAEVTGRLASLALRSGVDVQLVIDQLKGIAGEQPMANGDSVVLSIPDAVGKVLGRLYPPQKKGE